MTRAQVPIRIYVNKTLIVINY